MFFFPHFFRVSHILKPEKGSVYAMILANSLNKVLVCWLFPLASFLS